MKKLYIILILSIISLFLCSCGDFDVTCSIDSSNTAEMRIEFKIKGDGLTEYEISSLNDHLYDLSVYWENSLGYEIIENDNPNYLYDMTLVKKPNVKTRKKLFSS